MAESKSGLISHTSSRIVAAGGVSLKCTWAHCPSASTSVSGISCMGLNIATTDQLQAVNVMKWSGSVLKTHGSLKTCAITGAGKILISTSVSGFTNGLLQVLWTSNP
jgi:hypothetical protein